MSYLLFAESLKKCYIDVVNGDAENHNNHILDHSFGESISIVYNHSLIGIRSAHLLEAEKHVFKYIMLMTQNKSFTWDLMNLLRLIILSFFFPSFFFFFSFFPSSYIFFFSFLLFFYFSFSSFSFFFFLFFFISFLLRLIILSFLNQ